MRFARRLVRLLVLAVAGAGVLASPAAATAPLATGFLDGAYSADDPAVRAAAFSSTRDLGGTVVRVPFGWSGVAPASRPTGFDAQDPADPAYRFDVVDAAVREATARGLTVLLSFNGAPAWAEGRGRPAGAVPGSWRPDPGAVGDFARALARRYDGTFPDPRRPGAALPRVRRWQLWNEPNLPIYLSPQWERRGGALRPAAPGIYRAMLNAFYRGVKAVDRGSFVLSAGTAPYGDPAAGGGRLQPVRFWRELLCVGTSLRALPCSDPVHLDGISHHPYGIRGPDSHSLNADDAAIPDITKLTRVLRAAQRQGRVLPRARKRVWVTEMSWDSSPPDPQGVPVQTQARWLEQAFYVLWRQGVDTVLWFQVRDQPPNPSYAATNQSGVLYLDGSPKPSAQAFRFPFVVHRVARGRVQAWGRAPSAGRLTVERQVGAGWQTVRTLSVGTRSTFLTSFPLRGRATLRARIGADASLPWRVG
jgi:hypothetical protein